MGMNEETFENQCKFGGYIWFTTGFDWQVVNSRMAIYNAVAKIAVVTGGVLCLAVVDFAVKCIIDYIYQRKERGEVVFFRDKCINCKTEPCGSENCSYAKIRKLVKYIESAKKTLDICMFVITYNTLARAVVNVHRQGVKVRIITDKGMSKESSSQNAMLKSQGIPVRIMGSHFLMHHKFFIVDNQTLLAGSLNWTIAACTRNWEHVIISKEPMLVEPYVLHFSELWASLETCSK